MPSFEKRNDKWSVRFRTFDGAREHNKRLSGFNTKREAREAYEQFVVNNPLVKVDKSATPETSFAELVREWLDRKKKHVKESSYLTFRGKVMLYILPAFGDKKTTDITVADIEKWQEELWAKDLSYTYKNSIRKMLVGIFKLGKRRYKIPDVSEEVEWIKSRDEKREMHVWSPEEMTRFLSVVDDPDWHAFFHALYVTGMRRGEALALEKKDVIYKENKEIGKADSKRYFPGRKAEKDPLNRTPDAENRTLPEVNGTLTPSGNWYVQVNKSLTYKTEGGRYKITTPKTKNAVRTIYVPAALAEELLALPDGDRVFFSEPPAESAFLRRFRKYTEEAGLPQIRVHDLRHSHASFLISAGVPITAISKRLGHATIEQTLNTYAHLLPDDEEKVACAISTMRV